MSSSCILESRDSFSPCSDGALIPLGSLDGAPGSSGVVCKTSWIVLSRMGLNFLNTNPKEAVVCPSHVQEFFEAWSPPDGCVCGSKFIVKTESKVNLLLAVKVLRSEGKVLPIGSPLCESCWGHYERTYAPKPGERVMIILKKRKPQEPLKIKKEEPIDIKPSIVDLTDNIAEDPPGEKRLKPDSNLVDSEDKPPQSFPHSPPLSSSHLDSKYYCKLCKITFSKESSYRLHKKISLELHNRIKLRIRSQKLLNFASDEENEDGWKCVDCLIAFKDAITLQKHLAEIHFTVHHPFHCKSCNYIFKNQNAFKSHNSRMHVSRIDKIYYCRECDDTFACKLKHARHILIHRPWNGDPDALQCKACGKVFTKHQTLSYNKHLKYHNVSEFTEDCSCYDCSLEDEEEEEEETEASDEEVTPGSDEEDSGLEVLEEKKSVNPEDMSKPFQCSICPLKFNNPKDLEEHVTNGVHEDGLKTEDIAEGVLVPKKEEDIDPFQFLEESMVETDVKPSHPISVSDLLDKMRLSFQNQSYGNDDDSSAESNLEDDEERKDSGGLSPNNGFGKHYRGLPYKAYLKNNNMKSLLQRINTIAYTKSKSSSSRRPHSRLSDDEEDEDDNYSSSDLEEDSENEQHQNLLIPMENGWVCEKKWEEESNKYSTLFWSPDGLQHSSLAIIRFYGEKKNLNLNMDLFTRAVENNPPPPPS